jgi:hypothetical protein
VLQPQLSSNPSSQNALRVRVGNGGVEGGDLQYSPLN